MEDLAQYGNGDTLSFKYKDLNIIIDNTKQWRICLTQIFEMIAPYDLAKWDITQLNRYK
jgi:gamma-glutamyltranspeptidase/glutathione hydrolase